MENQNSYEFQIPWHYISPYYWNILFKMKKKTIPPTHTTIWISWSHLTHTSIKNNMIDYMTTFSYFKCPLELDKTRVTNHFTNHHKNNLMNLKLNRLLLPLFIYDFQYDWFCLQSTLIFIAILTAVIATIRLILQCFFLFSSQ